MRTRINVHTFALLNFFTIMTTKRKKKNRKPSVKSKKVTNKLGYGQVSKNYTTLRNIERVSDEEREFIITTN